MRGRLHRGRVFEQLAAELEDGGNQFNPAVSSNPNARLKFCTPINRGASPRRTPLRALSRSVRAIALALLAR
jgi:hypothetical protein